MREAMNKQPRTCSGGMKAIDAMQVYHLPASISGCAFLHSISIPTCNAI